MITGDQVLSAHAWSDLGIPRTAHAMRQASLAVHPDTWRDPRATEAFARLCELYDAPDFDLRVAGGIRHGPGVIQWTPKPGFADLADVADHAQRDLARTRFRRFFALGKTVPADSTARLVRYGEPGERWWFLSSFPRLDARTTVWVAKRLAAALNLADQSGWVHGDINPATIVLSPSEHGLKLDGWWTAIRCGERLCVEPSATTPPRYLSGAPADAKLGVGQGAATLLTVSALTSPLLDIMSRHAVNPGTPNDFFDEVDDAAQRMFGAPAWHHLADPAEDPI